MNTELDFIKNPRMPSGWSFSSNGDDARATSKDALEADGLPAELSKVALKLIDFAAPRTNR